jgi:hypothetical protein
MSDGQLRTSLVTAACCLRGLPLFFRASPKTPLRVLGIVALDILHVLRHARPMSRKQASDVALFMDFEGCTNADWDRKDVSETEYRTLRQRLEQSGLGWCIDEYLSRLRELERERPPVAGDYRRFDDVRAYREAVVRLSLATVTAIALPADSVDEGLRATHCNRDVDTLFRIAMQCQIIDDVLDYREDLSAGLPSFLTAAVSLPQAMAWTADAARRYASRDQRSSNNGVLSLRIGLAIVTAVTKLVVRFGARPQPRVHREGQRLKRHV